MTHWTDERVVAQLADTFTAHETDADPAVARRIALTPMRGPRRQWALIVAAAAAVLLVAGSTTYAVHTMGSKPAPVAATTPTGRPTVQPEPTMNGTNRDLATAEATRALAAMPVPIGSTRSNSAPTRSLGHLGTDFEPMDRSLTHTNWWVVPLSYTDLVAWYDAHTPALVSSAYVEGSTSPEPDGDFYWQIHDASKAYSDPTAVVAYARLGPHSTAIRTDVTLAARYDRTSATLAPGTVTSIDITKSANDGPARPPTTTTVTDPALLARVVAAFNNLDGAYAHTQIACASPVGLIQSYAVTFHWPGHTLAADPGAPLCGIGRSLTLDHTQLPQTLADGHGLTPALQNALEAS